MGWLQPSDWPARAWVASPPLPNTTDVSHREHRLVSERPKGNQGLSGLGQAPHLMSPQGVEAWISGFGILSLAPKACSFYLSLLCLPATDWRGENPTVSLGLWQKLSVRSPGFLSPLTSLASMLQPQLYGTNTGVTYILHWTPSLALGPWKLHTFSLVPYSTAPPTHSTLHKNVSPLCTSHNLSLLLTSPLLTIRDSGS